MVLRIRLVLILAVALASYIILDFVVQSLAVFPKFLHLEQEYADQDMQRCISALNCEVEHLRRFTNDWSAWDDTYEFIETGSTEYIEANFQPETFRESSMNVMYACRLDGTVVFGKVMDLNTGSYIELQDLPAHRLPADSPLLLQPDDLEGTSGIILLDGRPVLVAALPILTTVSGGPSRGALIFGRFLDDSLTEVLADQARVEFSIRTLPLPGDTAPDIAAAGRSAPSQAPFLHRLDSKKLRHAYARVEGLTGEPVLLIQARLERAISMEGRAALLHATVSNALASLIVVLLLILMLDLFLARRITQLNLDVTSIGESGNLSARLPERGADELGMLTRQINRMLDSLEHAEQARVRVEKHAAELETIQTTTATYAHEINNPLTGICGLAQLLLEEHAEVVGCREMLGDIMGSAMRIRDVIRKMEQLTAVKFKPYIGSTELLDLSGQIDCQD